MGGGGEGLVVWASGFCEEGWGEVEGLGQQAALFDRGGSCGDLDESGGKPSALQITALEGRLLFGGW